MANEQVIPTVGKAELNSEIKVEINTTPTGEAATYSDMRKAFKSVTTAINEVVYSATYLADGGFASSAVVGAAPTVVLTGDFIKDDPVCTFLDEIQYEIGSKRVTDIKITRNGKVLTCPVTVTADGRGGPAPWSPAGIGGGESTAPNTISCTIAFNGKPAITTATVSGV